MQTSNFAVFKENAYDHTDHQQACHQSMLGSRNIKLQMSTTCASTQDSTAPVGKCLPFYKPSSLRAWRTQQFSRFRVETTNLQSKRRGGCTEVSFTEQELYYPK